MEVMSVIVQGAPMNELHNSGPLRVLTTSLSYFSLLGLTLYSARLVSQLTSPTFTTKLNTIQELYQAGFTWSFDHLIEDMSVMFSDLVTTPTLPYASNTSKLYIFYTSYTRCVFS
jgi:hypothetical protein